MVFDSKYKEEYKEEPLKEWEKESVMFVIPEGGKLGNLLVGVLERVSNIEGIQIKEAKDWDKDNDGSIKLEYENEEYEIGFVPRVFSLSENAIRTQAKGQHFLSEEEIEKIVNVEEAYGIFMKFNADAKKSFQLQLKIALAIVPNLIGVYDESAEVILPPKYVKMTANSKVKPGPDELYVVQAVTGENGEIWLHTHGLCRCGITELEILQSNIENYENHYNLISTFASYLLDKKNYFNTREVVANIGMLVNKEPIVVTCVPWTKGLKEYKKNLNLGNITDREYVHNSKTSLIFIYKNKKDEINKKYSKVDEYNNLWGKNPLFYISVEETERMKALAIERFDFVKQEVNKKDNKIFVKLAVPVDSGDNLEHLWGEVVEVEGDRFKAKIENEAYYINELHAGDEVWFTIDSVTYWKIYTPKFVVEPSKAYLLVK